MYRSVEPIVDDGIGYRVAETEVLVDPQITPEMFLGAFMQNMQGPMLAGSPSPYYSGIEKTANDALFRYGMDQTPRGATLRKNIEQLRERYNLRGQPRGI
jgi:hypothetical protein